MFLWLSQNIWTLTINHHRTRNFQNAPFFSDWLWMPLATVYTLLFYQIEPLKNGVNLILPSSIARNSSHPIQKEFLKSCEGFLRAALIVYGHPGPVWKGSYESLAMLEGN